jgi:hypothetical protein
VSLQAYRGRAGQAPVAAVRLVALTSERLHRPGRGGCSATGRLRYRIRKFRRLASKMRRGDMKTRTILASLVVVLCGVALGFAAETDMTKYMGTWKLNDAKSKFGPGAVKNTTVTYAPAGENQVKITTDGVDKDGKPTHTEWTGKFDGKDYPVTGATEYDTRAYTPSGQHSLSMTIKKGGKTVITGKVSVAADGKTRTVTTTGAEPSMNNTAVYDKQ